MSVTSFSNFDTFLYEACKLQLCAVIFCVALIGKRWLPFQFPDHAYLGQGWLPVRRLRLFSLHLEQSLREQLFWLRSQPHFASFYCDVAVCRWNSYVFICCEIELHFYFSYSFLAFNNVFINNEFQQLQFLFFAFCFFFFNFTVKNQEYERT